MEFGLIYKVTNIINNKCYIGQTIKSLFHRKNTHYSNAFNKNIKDTVYNCHFYRAIRKYGKENFKWEVLCEGVPRSALGECEVFFINIYSAYLLGYNMTLGGDGSLGCTLSEFHKLKISQTLKGRKKSLQHVLRVAASNKGKLRSEQARQNISTSHGGRVFDVFEKNTKKYIGTWSNQSRCGRDLCIDRAKISLCLNKKYGRKSVKGYVFKYRE